MRLSCQERTTWPQSWNDWCTESRHFQWRSAHKCTMANFCSVLAALRHRDHRTKKKDVSWCFWSKTWIACWDSFPDPSNCSGAANRSRAAFQIHFWQWKLALPYFRSWSNGGLGVVPISLPHIWSDVELHSSLPGVMLRNRRTWTIVDGIKKNTSRRDGLTMARFHIPIL